MGKMKDITNLKFGKLTALNPTLKRSGNNIVWECICDCGKTAEVSGKHLRSGNTTSCGCNKGFPSTDLTNQKFGKLTTLYKNQENKNGRTHWHCKCECGSECDVLSRNLVNGHTISCGCSKSKGEEKIAQLLRANNISYQREYSFPDLRGINNGILRFDFAIFKNNNLSCLIEYDGKQHFIEHPNWGDFDNFQQNDKIKNEYCIKNSINLIRINYLQEIDLSVLGVY